MEKIKREREAVSKEGKLIDEMNEEYQEELERLEKIRFDQKKELRQTYDKTLETKKKLKQAEIMMDEEENEEIRAYANAKNKMAQLKRAKENEIIRDKQEKTEKMLAYLGSLLKEQVADEDFRIAKAVAQNEAKLAHEEYYKELKYRKEISEIDQYRLEIVSFLIQFQKFFTKLKRNNSFYLQIKRKEEERLNRQKDEEEEMRKKIEADLIHQTYELEKERQRKQTKEEFAKNNLKTAVCFIIISADIYDFCFFMSNL